MNPWRVRFAIGKQNKGDRKMEMRTSIHDYTEPDVNDAGARARSCSTPRTISP